MFVAMKSRSSSISSKIAPGNLELWPLNDKNGRFGLIRSLILKVLIQSLPNFMKMFVAMVSRSSSISSKIAPGTLELWPLTDKEWQF